MLMMAVKIVNKGCEKKLQKLHNILKSQMIYVVWSSTTCGPELRGHCSSPGMVIKPFIIDLWPLEQIWMCSGTLLIVTCSHVGHVFRKATPYTFPGGTGKIINHNNARLAEVWMDEWRDFYYKISPGWLHVGMS